MTTRTTITTLTLTVLLLSGPWTLAGPQTAAGSPAQVLQQDSEYLLPAGADSPLPIEMAASMIAQDPLWALRAFEEEEPASVPAQASPAGSDDGDYRLMDADGRTLSLGEEEILEFLRKARIVSRKRIGVGVNGVDKLLLEMDGVRLYAAFRDVSIRKHEERLASGTLVRHFRDDCMRELAAYRISRLLGLDFLPPVVQRTVRNRKGTLQVWVAGMTERERMEKKVKRPSKWFNQRQTMYLFDNLIHNPDRHPGNMILGEDGNLWAIDHTRSFWRNGRAVDLESLRRCDRTLWESLRNLDKQAVSQALNKILGPVEIEAFFQRHRMVVDHLQARIDSRGESVVLYGDAVAPTQTVHLSDM